MPAARCCLSLIGLKTLMIFRLECILQYCVSFKMAKCMNQPIQQGNAVLSLGRAVLRVCGTPSDFSNLGQLYMKN